jgi:flagellar basal-body rod protein FlgF
MLYQMDRLEAVTDNLANNAAPGYKKTVSSQNAFDSMVRSSAAAGRPDLGRSAAAVRSIDFSPGPLHATDNPLDFAINGDGFFVVEKDGREFYTRNGRFQLDPNGTVVTTGGFAVQGRNGPLTLPADVDLSQLTVAADGVLRSGERTLDAVRLASFADPGVLRRVGPTLFSAPADVEPQTSATSRATNRAVEGGNAAVFEEMAELIGTTRAFEICQRMLKQMDQAQGATIQQLSG